MVQTNGTSRQREFQPPPSSMLATHIVNQKGNTDISRNDFAVLLTESLGTDDIGAPNVGRDIFVNLKLLAVVVKVGIEPYTSSKDADPFRRRLDKGRNLNELNACLSVIQVILRETPNVIYADIDDLVGGGGFVYAWLSRVLLVLASKIADVQVVQSCIGALVHLLDVDEKCNCGSRRPVADYLRQYLHDLSGLLRKRAPEDTSIADIDHRSAVAQNLHHDSFANLSELEMLLAIEAIQQCLQDRVLPERFHLQLQKHRHIVQTMKEDMFTGSDKMINLQALNVRLASFAISGNNGRTNGYQLDQEFPDSDRARKRVKLTDDQSFTPDIQVESRATYIRKMTAMVTGNNTQETSSLPQATLEHFRRSSDMSRCQVLFILGRSACQLERNKFDSSRCSLCEDQTASDQALAPNTSELGTLSQVLRLLQQQIDRRPSIRRAALIAQYRLFKHLTAGRRQYLQLSTDGRFALQMLRSSSREARLLAIEVLRLLAVRFGHGPDAVVRDNRIAILEAYLQLWQSEKPPLQEISILGLASMAAIVDDDELNIILLRLIEYLGHTNSYLSSLVTSELLDLSQVLGTNIQGLLRPFWRTISIVIARNMASRPVIAQQLCDLLGMDLSGLLHMLEQYILPCLVASRQVAQIERVAQSSTSPSSVFEICSKPANLVKILAYLLAQGLDDPEESVMECLVEAAPDFADRQLDEWINTNASRIALELLKLSADSGIGKGSKVFQGLQVIGKLSHRRLGSSSGSKKIDLVSSFLEQNTLEMVTLATTALDDIFVREMHVERRRYLLALSELVRLTYGRVSTVIPHICACLRTAMADTALCDTAIKAWIIMAESLNEDDLFVILEQTYALVIQYWSIFNSESCSMVQQFFFRLFRAHQSTIKDNIERLPTLEQVDILQEQYRQTREWRKDVEDAVFIESLTSRLESEIAIMARQALRELVVVLRRATTYLHQAILRETPDDTIAQLIRNLLDCASNYSSDTDIVLLSAECLGIIGCVDSSSVELYRTKPSYVALTNFASADETTGFLMFFMEHVVVKEYVSASSLRSKTFLGWALQELLKVCQLPSDIQTKTRSGGLSGKEKQWQDLADETRLVLLPFLNSKLSLVSPERSGKEATYPIFKSTMTYETWLHQILLDLLERGGGQNASVVFQICWNMVNASKNTNIPAFLLPYAVLNMLLQGNESDRDDIMNEILEILKQPLTSLPASCQEVTKRASQAIFEVIDYLSKWLQEKRRWNANAAIRAERGVRDVVLEISKTQTTKVNSLLGSIPLEVMTQRAIDCKSYARAVRHWDEYIHLKSDPTDRDFRLLQKIYAEIDEPDGIEGISSCMQVLDAGVQVLENQKAGRWQAVQNWYELELDANPEDEDVRLGLLGALKQTGQHEVLLHHFRSMLATSQDIDQHLLPLAIEAAWCIPQVKALPALLDLSQNNDHTSKVATYMTELQKLSQVAAGMVTSDLWISAVADISYASTASFNSCTYSRLLLHRVEDIRILNETSIDTKASALDHLTNRLQILRTNLQGKQSLLSVHRALMTSRPDVFSSSDIATSWLVTAKLARKAGALTQASDAVLRAEALGDQSVVLEQTKLMWLEGRHRKAIKTLEGAICSGVFNAHTYIADQDQRSSRSAPTNQNNLLAKAYVRLGKWLDQAGQTQSDTIISTFNKCTDENRLWERGWYHLGKHHNKILDSERVKPAGKETQPFLTGDSIRVIINMYLRALACGNNHLFETLPKVLTLWLELVSNPKLAYDSERGNAKFHDHVEGQRKKIIAEANAIMKKYTARLPPVTLYTILQQIVARICHATKEVYDILLAMIAKVVHAFPQQAMWTLMQILKSQDKTRSHRGMTIVSKITELQKESSNGMTPTEMRFMITQAQKFTDEILRVADYPIEGKVSKVSLGKVLQFNHKIAPSKLVVPVEASLIPNIPVSNDSSALKGFRAFAKEPVTISAFMDEALVLASLMKPRKMTIRGSDGNTYGVLAKPKDDLRKDQRLMEFSTMINRFLKHDMSASARRLNIRTYAVVPLNEECGLIEWVPNLKTLRDIILKLYREAGHHVDYGAIRSNLDDICTKSENKAKDFTERVLPAFPALLRYWFVETYPDPSTWLTARILYTRSTAVMSMVGHILGLGDRHGENILFQEDTGGIMHVDFNCLFDKGLTFDKPEMVPFRLTHNMIDAFGTFGIEGPFRRCCEITMDLLRNNEGGLLTILETFAHDPTTDFMAAGKKRKAKAENKGFEVPDTAEAMLEAVKGKLRGMIKGESVPLSVGGYVEEQIKRASDRGNLAQMYIGWCAFL